MKAVQPKTIWYNLSMPRIYLVRHATPDWDCKTLPYHIPPGPPLTDQGQQEAQELGAFLKGVGAAYFYTSPLERCLNTARISASIVGAPLEIKDELTEIQPGESKTSMQNRLCPIFDLARQTSSQQGPVVLVTHGAPVTVLLGQLGMDEDEIKRRLIYDHRNPLPPAGAWLAEQSGADQPWKLSLVFTPEAIKTFT